MARRMRVAAGMVAANALAAPMVLAEAASTSPVGEDGACSSAPSNEVVGQVP